MSELKTLKDLPIIELGNAKFYADKWLREEAIKWLKHIAEIPEDEKSGWYGLGAVGFIQHFFNITEEDLK